MYLWVVEGGSGMDPYLALKIYYQMDIDLYLDFEAEGKADKYLSRKLQVHQVRSGSMAIFRIQKTKQSMNC